jgi:hypothetical protein
MECGAGAAADVLLTIFGSGHRRGNDITRRHVGHEWNLHVLRAALFQRLDGIRIRGTHAGIWKWCVEDNGAAHEVARVEIDYGFTMEGEDRWTRL